MSSIPRASSQKRKKSPSCRQDILTQRLLLALEPTSEQDATRKQPSPCAVPSVASPVKSGSKSLLPIDIYETWKEISSVFPLLSYGEESNELFLALMGVSPSNAAEVDDERLLRGLESVLSDMLRVSRNFLRDDALAIAVGAEQNATKKQKISSYQSLVTTSNEGVNVRESNKVLPWNVLLRVVVRFAAFVTKRVQSKCIEKMHALKDPVPTIFVSNATTLKYPLKPASEDSLPMQKPESVQSAVSATVETSNEVADVASMNINDIRRELSKRGLDVKGKKADLIERFQPFLADFNTTNSMAFNGIRTELTKRGRDSTGKKIELIERLQRPLKGEMAQKKSVKKGGRGDNAAENSTECNMSTPTKAAVSNQSTNLTPKASNISVSKSTVSLQTKSNSKDDTVTNGNFESAGKGVHPIIQALDIVLSELTIMLRREQRSRLKKQQKSRTSLVAGVEHKNAGTNVLEHDKLQSSLTQEQPSHAALSLAKDRMIHDWSNKSRCGPSRYAFMKDVDSITHNLDLAFLDITQEEWQEKMDTIICYLDEYVGFNGNDIVHTAVGNGVLGRSSFGMSPKSSPFRRSPSSSPFNRSPFSSPFKSSMAAGISLADITRVHVKRAIDMGRETERDASRKNNAPPLPAKKPDLCRSLNMKTLDPIPEVEATDDEIDQLEDAYRMALAFSDSIEESQSNARCDVIKRHLELLVKQLNGPKEKKRKSAIGGADSYLRLLLRDLLQPSDPAVWARLVDETHGKDVPMQLRRGRSSLVSFLNEIHSPGWDEVCPSLEPSPLANYLGFLPDSAPKKEQQNAMFLSSSFLLPVDDDNVASIPPPPVVTEIGLSACISNFLKKERGANSSCISYVFSRKAGPDSLGKPDPILESIAVTLPDLGELTRDLFDLTLRLAADDDSEHKSKPFPLRLATPSASESLRIVLDVVSDHAEWLEPLSVSKRYQSVMEMTMLSFGRFEDKERSEEKSTWESRLVHLIRMAKTVQNRARIAIYATHFMIMLCSKKPSSEWNCGQSKFYNRLHLHKFSQFWNDIEETSNGYCTNIMARVFDETFCIRRLLPLSHRCSVLLASSMLPSLRAEQQSCVGEEAELALSLVTILCTVFGLLAEDNLLADCIHVGWSVELLSLSISSFIKCKNAGSDYVPARNLLWHRVLEHLMKLYHDGWHNYRPDLYVRQSQPSVSQKTVSFVCIENGNGNVRTWCLMPSFDVLVASLVGFTSNENLGDEAALWCKFVSAFLLDRYARVLPMNAVALTWIGSLASILQREVLCQQALELKDDVSIHHAVNRLMNPLLKSLHCTIMTQHALRGSSRSKPFTSDCDMIATVFADLFRLESAKILTRPSSLKTRKWYIYRACIDSIFVSTPPGTLFTSLGCSSLTESSAEALQVVWEHFGQSHPTLIMVAAGFHVDASVTRLQSTNIDIASKKLKMLCDAFTLQAKECITNSMTCFAPKHSDFSSDDSTIGFYELAHDVARDLTADYAEAGLIWWNELTSSLSSLLANASKSTRCDPQNATKAMFSRRRRNISCIFSTLEESLSAINHST